MVVKQKGGELRELQIPDKLTEYFECVINLFTKINEFINLFVKLLNRISRNDYTNSYTNRFKIEYIKPFNDILKIIYEYLKSENFMIYKQIVQLKAKIEEYRNREIKNSRTYKIFNINVNNSQLNDINYQKKYVSKMKDLLFDLSSIIMDNIIPQIYNKCNDSNLVKLYIALLLTEYIRINNLSDNNPLIHRLYYILLERDLPIEIRNLFFRIKSVPIFYGNGYNQFICEKVGVFSSNKRKYTINPVAAIIARTLIRSDGVINKDYPLYKLLGKILRFEYYEGNKYNKLPELIGLPNGTKFCIVKDRNGNEEVITGDLSRCSKKGFGCSLKMTAEIRKENIAPDEDIFELLRILLNMYLEKGEENSRRRRSNLKNRKLRRNNLLNSLKSNTRPSQVFNNNERNRIRNITIQKLQKDIQNLEENLNTSNQNSDFNYKSNLLNSLRKQLEILEKNKNRLTPNEIKRLQNQRNLL